MSQRLNHEQLDEFINDVLKEDLKYLEQHINKYNDEIMEFVQLKNTIQTMRDHLPEGYKTQMNIGGNMFMQARVPQAETMLVDVGLHCYLELTLEDALRFAELRIKVLTKECDVLREESIKKRTQIKLALLVMNEQQQLVQVASES